MLFISQQCLTAETSSFVLSPSITFLLPSFNLSSPESNFILVLRSFFLFYFFISPLVLLPPSLLSLSLIPPRPFLLPSTLSGVNSHPSLPSFPFFLSFSSSLCTPFFFTLHFSFPSLPPGPDQFATSSHSSHPSIQKTYPPDSLTGHESQCAPRHPRQQSQQQQQPQHQRRHQYTAFHSHPHKYELHLVKTMHLTPWQPAPAAHKTSLRHLSLTP